MTLTRSLTLLASPFQVVEPPSALLPKTMGSTLTSSFFHDHSGSTIGIACLVGLTFKIYPESNHFSPLPQSRPWSKPPPSLPEYSNSLLPGLATLVPASQCPQHYSRGIRKTQVTDVTLSKLCSNSGLTQSKSQSLHKGLDVLAPFVY